MCFSGVGAAQAKICLENMVQKRGGLSDRQDPTVLALNSCPLWASEGRDLDGHGLQSLSSSFAWAQR